jgi:hypothetical protein
MPLACLFVDDSPVTLGLHSITVVALVGRHEFDPAVAVLMVVTVRKNATH